MLVAYACTVTQSCPTLCNPMDCSPPGSPVHGILQARILEWVAISFSRGSSQPRDRTPVSYIAGRFFTIVHKRDSYLLCVWWGVVYSQEFCCNHDYLLSFFSPHCGYNPQMRKLCLLPSYSSKQPLEENVLLLLQSCNKVTEHQRRKATGPGKST